MITCGQVGGGRTLRPMSAIDRIRSAARPPAGGDRLHAALSDPGRYRDQIDRLHEHHLLGRGVHDLRQGEVSLASVVIHRDEVARVLATTVAAGDYRFSPAERRSIRVRGRLRTVYSFGLADVIVARVVTDVLERALAGSMSPALYSYRPGRAWWSAASDLARYVRVHQRRPVPADRDLYVIRRDVAAYTDTIPVGPGSPVWPMLRTALRAEQPGVPIRDGDWALVEAVVRPAIRTSGGPPRRLERGVPTGQPISVLLFNVYLADIDTAMAAIPGAFYARYSDDLVFAHTSPDVVQAAAARITAMTNALGLRLNDSKARDLYLTAAGRASAAWRSARGTDHVDLIGLRVDARGRVGLSDAKARELIRDLGRRAKATARHGGSEQEGVRLAAGMVRIALEPGDPDKSARAARLLRSVVTDRSQLADLDARIARTVAEAVTGRPSVRAFRGLPPRALRAAGLPSLVEARNAFPERGRPLRRRRGG